MAEPTNPADVAALQRELAHLAGFVRGYMAARGFGPLHSGTPEQWPYYGFGVSDGRAWAQKTRPVKPVSWNIRF